MDYNALIDLGDELQGRLWVDKVNETYRKGSLCRWVPTFDPNELPWRDVVPVLSTLCRQTDSKGEMLHSCSFVRCTFHVHCLIAASLEAFQRYRRIVRLLVLTQTQSVVHALTAKN